MGGKETKPKNENLQKENKDNKDPKDQKDVKKDNNSNFKLVYIPFTFLTYQYFQ